MTSNATAGKAPAEKASWQKAVAPYQNSDMRLSLWQIANSFIPYILMWVLMYYSLSISYWLTLLLAFPTGGFAMRIFIIFHDCGHGSFFKSKKANNFVGAIAGFIVFTPYYAWRHSHAVHHASSGDLDRRGIGDVWTLTLEEYRQLPRLQQIGYRVYRNPFFIFVVGPFVDFVFLQRLPSMNDAHGQREKNSVHITNLAIVLIAVGVSLVIGFKNYLLIQVPILAFTSSFGVWLFYVQHQYENVYWERHDNWDYTDAALYGSSFYKLPRILQWFTGNIGFHHIHHLSPRIPNYELEKCHTENPMFQVEPLTLRTSLKSLRIRVWDENRHKMVGYHPKEEHVVDPEELEAAGIFPAAPEISEA